MIYIHNFGTKFYFITDYNAPNRKVIEIDIEDLDEVNWKDVIPEHPKNVLKDCKWFDDKLIVYYLQDASY